MREGKWWENGSPKILEERARGVSRFALFQAGPKPDGIPPGPVSSLDERMGGYPNELAVDLDQGQVHANVWPPDEVPKSFQRWTNRPDGGMVGNFATGITKTTELVLDFHPGSDDASQIRETMNIVLDPAVAHAPPEWYRGSGVYGTFATAANDVPALERGPSTSSGACGSIRPGRPGTGSSIMET